MLQVLAAAQLCQAAWPLSAFACGWLAVATAVAHTHLPHAQANRDGKLSSLVISTGHRCNVQSVCQPLPSLGCLHPLTPCFFFWTAYIPRPLLPPVYGRLRGSVQGVVSEWDPVSPCSLCELFGPRSLLHVAWMVVAVLEPHQRHAAVMGGGDPKHPLTVFCAPFYLFLHHPFSSLIVTVATCYAALTATYCILATRTLALVREARCCLFESLHAAWCHTCPRHVTASGCFFNMGHAVTCMGKHGPQAQQSLWFMK